VPSTPHIERHFSGSQAVRNIVIGMSDGLTVPFALAAGLSGAVESTRIVVTAGLAEVAAGSIAMGLGGYLAAKSDMEHYASELTRERREVVEMPEAEVAEVEQVFGQYGLTPEQVAPVVEAFRSRPQAWVEFMMRYELGLEQPDPKAALTGALTIATAYVVGGLIPLAPYFAAREAHSALGFSVGVTLVALFLFGYVKGRFTGARPIRSAIQTTLIGGLAAGAAFALAKMFA
jgi:VIT1/CCC1 family predicted Fe2+/Mn2+ transporter